MDERRARARPNLWLTMAFSMSSMIPRMRFFVATISCGCSGAADFGDGASFVAKMLRPNLSRDIRGSVFRATERSSSAGANLGARTGRKREHLGAGAPMRGGWGYGPTAPLLPMFRRFRWSCWGCAELAACARGEVAVRWRLQTRVETIRRTDRRYRPGRWIRLG